MTQVFYGNLHFKATSLLRASITKSHSPSSLQAESRAQSPASKTNNVYAKPQYRAQTSIGYKTPYLVVLPTCTDNSTPNDELPQNNQTPRARSHQIATP